MGVKTLARFIVENNYSESKKKSVFISPNTITIVVGKNGYGKTSFIQGLRSYAKIHNHSLVEWSDSEHGRSNGMSSMLWNNNLLGVASMAFHSEGEAMLASFGQLFISKVGRTVRKLKESKPKSKKIFLLIDQIDSGLDIHQIDYIKSVLRDTIIPDINKSGFEAYVILSANSYELVNGEDCIDPVTRSHMRFDTYDEYVEYITNQYSKGDNDE
jgi:hypothetical protein